LRQSRKNDQSPANLRQRKRRNLRRRKLNLRNLNPALVLSKGNGAQAEAIPRVDAVAAAEAVEDADAPAHKHLHGKVPRSQSLMQLRP